jgi:hypothetical protein
MVVIVMMTMMMMMMMMMVIIENRYMFRQLLGHLHSDIFKNPSLYL